jgi:hypothetical protein
VAQFFGRRVGEVIELGSKFRIIGELALPSSSSARQ